jgi:hypothetical protein
LNLKLTEMTAAGCRCRQDRCMWQNTSRCCMGLQCQLPTRSPGCDDSCICLEQSLWCCNKLQGVVS